MHGWKRSSRPETGSGAGSRDRIAIPGGGHSYKRAFGEPKAKAQSNFTDPESGIMKTSSEGFQQCYNSQVVVDGKNQMSVATVVGRGATDQGQLLPMLNAAAATGGRMPAEVLADAGYCNEANLAALEARGIRGHVRRMAGLATA